MKYNLNAMKPHMLLLLILCFFENCDTRDTVWITKDNEAPALLFSNQKNELVDSAKYSLKLKQEKIVLTFSVRDQNNNAKEAKILRMSGTSVEPTSTALDLSLNPKASIACNIKGTGMSVFTITVSDWLGFTAMGKYSVLVFDNISPTARLTATADSQDKFTYQLNASDSKDGDARFGGTILLYSYDIDGYKFSTKLSTIPWSFASTGAHTIKLKVTDNDHAESNEFIQEIKIL